MKYAMVTDFFWGERERVRESESQRESETDRVREGEREREREANILFFSQELVIFRIANFVIFS